MKIVHIASSIFGGAGIGMLRYHKSLVATGVDSRIIAGNISQTSHEINKISRTIKSLPRRISTRISLFQTEADKMQDKVKKLDQKFKKKAQYELFSLPFSDFHPEQHPWIEEADIINLHWVAGVLDWQNFFGLINKPIAITLHDQQNYLGGFHYTLDLENNPHMIDLENEVREIKKNALCKHKIAVVANSNWNAQEAKKSNFFNFDVPIKTIYYPLNADAFQAKPKQLAKQKFGISSNQSVIGFASENLNNRRKGFNDLVEALCLLPRSVRQTTTLLSFGREPDIFVRERIPMTWIHLGFLNHEADQSIAYSAMDIFVIPSRAEAFGQTALEAIACGTLVIGANIGGISEAISVSENSKLYDSSNIKKLSELIEQMLNKDSVNTKMRLDEFNSKHSSLICSELHMQLYNNLCN